MDPRLSLVEPNPVVDAVTYLRNVDYPVHDQLLGNGDPQRRHHLILPARLEHRQGTHLRSWKQNAFRHRTTIVDWEVRR